MKRVVIGGRNRVLGTRSTHFFSGAALAADFGTYQAEIEPASLIIWTWYALDAEGKPDLDATLRGTDAILGSLEKLRVPLIFLSTDAVFSGSTGGYDEADAPDPQTDYAGIKWAQEQLMRDFPRLRFTTFGPSHNHSRPLMTEMIARSAIKIDRPKQIFSPISTITLDETINAIAAEDAAPRVYHLTSEAVSKADCVRKIAEAIGTPLPADRTIDMTPLDLSLHSATHSFSLDDEIARAVAAHKAAVTKG